MFQTATPMPSPVMPRSPQEKAAHDPVAVDLNTSAFSIGDATFTAVGHQKHVRMNARHSGSLAGLDSSFQNEMSHTFASKSRLAKNMETQHAHSRSALQTSMSHSHVADPSNAAVRDVFLSSCCGTGVPSGKVKGLFVTYCQHDIEQGIRNMHRDMECEAERHRTAERHQDAELLRLLREKESVAGELDKTRTELKEYRAWAEAELKAARVIRDEHERRAEEERRRADQLRQEMSNMQVETNAALAAKIVAENALNDMKADYLRNKDNLGKAERMLMHQSTDTEGVAREKEALRITYAKCEADRARLEELAEARGKVIDGLQKELTEATEQLNAVALFREALHEQKDRPKSMLRAHRVRDEMEAAAAALAAKAKADKDKKKASPTQKKVGESAKKPDHFEKRDKLFERYFSRGVASNGRDALKVRELNDLLARPASTPPEGLP